MSVQLGAFVGDLPYVALAVAGWHGVATAVPTDLLVLSSAAVLILLGALAMKNPAPRPVAAEATDLTQGVHRLVGRGFMEGLVLAAMNPLSIAFWLSATAGSAGSHLGENVVLAVGAFFTGNLLCAALLSAGVSYVRRHTRPGFWTGMGRSCGLALIALGLVVAYSSV
jgi:threonine/homoserine/homoserine lactone efflux protein